MKTHHTIRTLLASSLMALSLTGAAMAAPFSVEEQGSFTVGGTYVTHPGTFNQEDFLSPDGQRAYGDFAYVEYQIPEHAKKLHLLFQHGGGQSKRTWESTVDGREGFNTLFVRAGYAVYLLDQPHTGESNYSTTPITPDTPWTGNPMYADKTFWILCRMGHYDENGNPVPNEQFPEGEAAYKAFQQFWTQAAGPLDNDLNASVLAELADQQKDGAILVTHSMGGSVGWRAALKSQNVKAIIAFEPGGTPFVFPEDEMPEITQAKFAPLSASAMGVSREQYKALTRIPILLIYGDHMEIGSDNVGEDKWGTELKMARQFADTINRNGGDATLIHLPEIGIKGNSHFLMGEKNNKEILQIALDWLHEKGLDK